MKLKKLFFVFFISAIFLCSSFSIVLTADESPGSEWYQSMTLIDASSEGYSYARSPGVGVMPNGDIWAIAGLKGIFGDDSDTDIWYSKSTDNGNSWSSPILLLDNISEVQGGKDEVTIMGSLICDNSNSRMYMCLFVKPTPHDGHSDPIYGFVQYTEDNGSTWAGRVNLTSKYPSWASSDYCPIDSGGFVSPNGTIVIPFWGWDVGNSERYQFAIASYPGDVRSNIDGWHLLDGYAGRSESWDTNENSLCYLDDHRWLCMARHDTSSSPYMFFSSDNGSSWSNHASWIYTKEDARTDLCVMSSNVTYGGVHSYSGAPVIHDKGRVLYSWLNDSSRPGDIAVALSYDNASSWEYIKDVSPSSDGYYSDMTVTQNNTIIVVYEADSYTKLKMVQFNLEWLTDSNDYVVDYDGSESEGFSFVDICGQSNNSDLSGIGSSRWGNCTVPTIDNIPDSNVGSLLEVDYYQVRVANDSGFSDVFINETGLDQWWNMTASVDYYNDGHFYDYRCRVKVRSSD